MSALSCAVQHRVSGVGAEVCLHASTSASSAVEPLQRGRHSIGLQRVLALRQVGDQLVSERVGHQDRLLGGRLRGADPQCGIARVDRDRHLRGQAAGTSA